RAGRARARPLGARAPARERRRPDLLEAGVPAGGAGREELAGVVGGLLPVLGGPLGDADGPPGDVGVDVGVVLARAQPPGPGAGHLQHLVGQVAGPVLGAGPPLPEGDVREGVAGDVGDAPLGAADGGLVLVALAEDPAVGPLAVAAVGGAGEAGAEQCGGGQREAGGSGTADA